MPIYEYTCDNCGYEFEKIQKISDEDLKKCPHCEQDSLRKLVSAAGFRLKGGGWYETDFKKGAQKNLVSSETKSPASTKSSSNTSGSTE